MLSFLTSILGCSGNNTLEVRFEQGRAIFWPKWNQSDLENAQPHTFLLGHPSKPALSMEGFEVFLSNGKILSLSSKSIREEVSQSFNRMGEYEVGGKAGPAIHPGKSYFEWPPSAVAIYKHGALTAFFVEDGLIAISFDNESDALDKIVFNGQKFGFPIRLKDLKVILGSPTSKQHYFSQ
jgi:hypothetical protein